jgi:serine/threonine-protein kinase
MDTQHFVGAVIDGRYQLGELLGEGATSTVYRAVHLGTGRAVAVKVLKAALVGDGIAVERFLREARAGGHVVHPNVVAVFDVGSDDARRPYLVTELVEGETLAAWLGRTPGPLPLREVAALVLPLLDGLAVAHAAGIVHRDLKPENVVLCREPGGALVPKLLDFGVSKIRRPWKGSMVELTVPGTGIGTPHYMSPEQALDSRDAGPPADVWAAGVLLYRLTTGRLPFDAPSPGGVLEKLFDVIPPAPAASGVAPAVSTVILRCLAKRVADRYPDARALQLALCTALGLPHNAGSPQRPALPSLRVAPVPEAQPTVRPPARAAIALEPRDSIPDALPRPPALPRDLTRMVAPSLAPPDTIPPAPPASITPSLTPPSPAVPLAPVAARPRRSWSRAMVVAAALAGCTALASGAALCWHLGLAAAVAPR